jgi:3-deoxy-D-manno-octulosonate 8-phosphate phosphatase (KDO 8-P phosphatase)
MSESGNAAEGPIDRWRTARALLLDSDGVLTDGGVFFGAEGEGEFRRFDIKDGFGLARLAAMGFPIAILSRSSFPAIRTRAERLGLHSVFLGVDDKVKTADFWRQELGLAWEELAFMGDDIPDLALLARVGLALGPVDAVPTVRARVHWTSNHPGGQGAVREACDRLLVLHYGLSLDHDPSADRK